MRRKSNKVFDWVGWLIQIQTEFCYIRSRFCRRTLASCYAFLTDAWTGNYSSAVPEWAVRRTWPVRRWLWRPFPTGSRTRRPMWHWAPRRRESGSDWTLIGRKVTRYGSNPAIDGVVEDEWHLTGPWWDLCDPWLPAYPLCTDHQLVISQPDRRFSISIIFRHSEAVACDWLVSTGSTSYYTVF